MSLPTLITPEDESSSKIITTEVYAVLPQHLGSCGRAQALLSYEIKGETDRMEGRNKQISPCCYSSSYFLHKCGSVVALWTNAQVFLGRRSFDMDMRCQTLGFT
ncbi:hypothetical protein MRB53_014228 [Persea americana]|uniref:Uncharacterized protein n=1 Tax=Persea americana TaxID=3435 RepID=A0ACC2KAA3_PERAE|nr:hypothetical protein MRB53_014228 [Persea americana]